MYKSAQDNTGGQRVLFPELGANTTDRPEGELAVTGHLPERLRGVLYRNGPGMFRRGGQTKTTLLDGDGVVQRLELDGRRAHYMRRFVRTPKFQAEEAAGRFIRPTWTTRSRRFWRNVGSRQIASQAGITSCLVHGVLQALDEVAPGFEIDPQTLETGRPVQLGLPDGDQSLKAHSRYLAGSGDWLFISTRPGRHGMSLDIVRHRADGQRIPTPTVMAPRMVYLHDFAATERHAIMLLQPAFLRPFRFLSGMSSLRDALAWRPGEGTVVMVIDLHSGAAMRLEAPPAWVWHMANAHERGNELSVDFVGYDDPWHFLGPNAQLAAIMQGRDGVRGAPGHLCRYRIDLKSRRLTYSILSDGNFEFPSVDARCAGTKHRRIFVTHGSGPGVLHSGIAAFDCETGDVDAFDFGPHVNAGEPVFAADPEGGIDDGWLITQVLDTRRGASRFAIFDARHVGDGPMAFVELDETLPFSFHGQWVGR